MKQLILALLLSLFALNVFSQHEHKEKRNKQNSLTVGILQGGGSLVGFDYERLLSKRFGVQVGLGYIGYGAGINFHLQPTVRSSFISLQYWHQGIGEKFAQSLVGPNFVFRGKKWFTCQLGLGVPLKKGPNFPEGKDQPPVMLMYSIGGYIPF